MNKIKAGIKSPPPTPASGGQLFSREVGMLNFGASIIGFILVSKKVEILSNDDSCCPPLAGAGGGFYQDKSGIK